VNHAIEKNLTLMGAQHKLIAVVAAASPKPIVVVIISGGGIDLSDALANPKVGAIIWAGYPGQSGGRAIAETIYGDNNPGGRLPATVYPQKYTYEADMWNMNMRSNSTTGFPGRTYRFYNGVSVWPFGFGLSFTTFSYQWTDPLLQSTDGITLASLLSISSLSIRVTNTGTRAGDAVVLAFLVPPTPTTPTDPNKTLFGFARVELLAGANAVVNIPIDATNFQLADSSGMWVTRTGKWRVSIDQPESLYLIVAV